MLYNRSGEQDPTAKMSGLVPVMQLWHKKKVVTKIADNGQSLDAPTIDENTFLHLIEEIFERINLFGRWTEQPSWGSKDYSSDEFLMFSLGQSLFCAWFCCI